MTAPSERSPRGGLGRLIAGAVAYLLLAPPALVALPLAALLAVSRPRAPRELAVAAAAGTVALWWLLEPGELPDQLVRAAAVWTTAAFAVVTLRTGATVTHRALLSVATAGGAVGLLLAALGISWGELHWWVERRAGLEARFLITQLWGVGADGAGILRPGMARLDEWSTQMVAFIAHHFPAIVACQLLAGLALATAVYHRVAQAPRGRPLGRLREFRFTEHLGWAAAIPLAVVLIPKLVAAKTAASNLLLVAGVLYALRGLAVAAFGLHLAGGAGPIVWVLCGIVALVMLPIVAGGAVVLGVLDAGLDLRRRWTAAARK